MFYSETLLSKTGPLARVWLSANLERKLSKTHILQSNIETSVGAIVGQDQAPMALRLSGQLLLGVVRIYSRKARYLLEDCNEALMKIKMAFRPGNVDLPAGAISHTSAQLTLPDVITELDLLLPDPTLDLGGLGDLPVRSGHQKRNADITLDPDSFVSSLEQPRGFDHDDDLQLEDEILDIDIGEDRDMPMKGLEDLIMGSDSMEIGRNAPLGRDLDGDLFDESRMSLGLGDITPKAPREPTPVFGFDDDGLDLGLDDDNTAFGRGMDIDLDPDLTIQPPADQEATPAPETTAPVAADEEAPRERTASVAPAAGAAAPAEHVSEEAETTVVREESVAPQAEAEGSMFDLNRESEDIESDYAAQEQPRRRTRVVIDTVTEIKAKELRAQQADGSRLMKEPSYLPRDPAILSLMSLSQSGGLARSICYPRNIAPELANLLSPEFVRRMAEKKRKRDAARAIEEEGEETRPSPSKQPRLLIEEEEQHAEPPVAAYEEDEVAMDEVMELPDGGDASVMHFPEEQDDLGQKQGRGGSASPQPDIIPQGDVTQEEQDAMGEPMLEPNVPSVPQVVSRETRHAVHVLREQFEVNPKKTVVFQELLPTQTTTKMDATKMFFEVLVLATKDAIKVKQTKGFGQIDIQQKKALWGAWAEEKDEQQIAEEEERARDAEKEAGRSMIIVGTGRTVGEATAAA